jgi:trk system potassium uptake protein TrkH
VRPAAVAFVLGVLLMMFSPTLLVPAAVGWWYGDGAVLPFPTAAMACLAGGVALWYPVRRRRPDLRTRDGFAIVVLFWVALSVVGALPFMFAAHPHMHLAQAVFEAVSGLTTTGATVLSGLDALPHAILYYRSQLQFLGGMGIVVLAVAILPMLGVGGMQLYRAETPGPMKDEKLTPRIAETAKSLWYVYVGLNVLCTAAFWLAGMNLFDAVNHSFATIALGGFSTHDASLGYFRSPAVEVVGGVFSLLAGINFSLHFVAWRSLNPTVYLRDPECKAYLGVLTLLVAVTCAYLYMTHTFPLRESVYHGFFQSLSVITDNGLSTIGYPSDWPAFLPVLLAIGSFFGGCAGSTCGGIKALRFLLLYKQGLREAKLLIHPRAQIMIKIGARTLPERVMNAVWGFVFLYVGSYLGFSLILMAMGLDPMTAFGSVACCMNNMGIGLGATASNFATLKSPELWVLNASMLVGRFEVFPLLLLLLPDFWRK